MRNCFLEIKKIISRSGRLHLSTYIFVAAGLVATICCVSCGDCDTVKDNQRHGSLSWIDTHTHPIGTDTDCVTLECIEETVALMDNYRVSKAILMHPPATYNDVQQETLVKNAVSFRPDRFFYGGGGNILNSMIQLSPDHGLVPDELLDQFDRQFKSLVENGDSVVIGELTVLHLSYYEGHAFEEKPANCPLLLHLADLTAAAGVPVDIHMDVVVEDMPTPSYFVKSSSTNPPTLKSNIFAFEELLEHNRDAKIVLAHAGRDTTGHMSADLMGRLMAAHPNLYLQIHPVNLPLSSQTAIIDPKGTIRPRWLELLQQYPNRIVIGSDEFLKGESESKEFQKIQSFLEQLPEQLARQIGCINPVEIYGLPGGC